MNAMMESAKRVLGVIVFGLLVTMTAKALAAEPEQAGANVYRKCQACHSLDAGVNTVGPSLHGVFGRPAGSLEDYTYSTAMKQSDQTWDEAALDAFLADPWETVPGNKMPFRLQSVEDRRAVVAYLKSISDAGAASAFVAPATTAATVVATADLSIPADYIPDVKYTLRTSIAEGRMVYIGLGGTIDGIVNPELFASEGDTVQLTLINGDGAEHDIVFPDQGVWSQHVVNSGASTTIAFGAKEAGQSSYFCSLPGHRQGIYETRPEICREYGASADEPCEYFTDDLEYDQYFDSDEKFQTWAEAELERRKQKRKRTRRRKALQAAAV